MFLSASTQAETKQTTGSGETLSAYANLAYQLGMYAQAAEKYELVRAALAAKLGLDHPDTLTSMDNLANSYVALKRNEEAFKL